MTDIWKKQTVFAEEVEDEYWGEYRAKEKSSNHLLYRDRDDDDLEQRKEAYTASKAAKSPKSEDINTEEPASSSQKEFPPLTSDHALQSVTNQWK